ncbi:LacI family DNA-binding transcriptional regulator [Natronospora cellulosivora (SeqCode)]
MAKVSIKDVAKLAGVSPTTVSRVINNSDHPVSDKSRKAVEEAVQELNFQPNRMAQGLSSNKSNIIGVIVHDISDDYFAEILKGIESVLYNYDYIVNIYNTYRDVDKELKAVNMLRANSADALVFTGGSLLDEHYKEKMKDYINGLKKEGCFILGVTAHPDIETIDLGNFEATKEICRYLFINGHRNIAYVHGPKILNTSRDRYKGFLEAHKDEGVVFDENYLYESDFSFEGGRMLALKIIEKIDKVTAIVASNDETALGILWELKNQGYNVPEDISLVGIGNIPSTRYSYPPLTTISLPIYQIGVTIGKRIINSLQKGEDIEIELDSKIELVERESVKKINY